MQYSTHLLRHLRLTIGQNINRLRVDKAMSQPELARLSNVPERRLKQYEIGKHKIELDSICRIACVLDVRVQDLVAGSDTGIV